MTTRTECECEKEDGRISRTPLGNRTKWIISAAFNRPLGILGGQRYMTEIKPHRFSGQKVRDEYELQTANTTFEMIHCPLRALESHKLAMAEKAFRDVSFRSFVSSQF